MPTYQVQVQVQMNELVDFLAKKVSEVLNIRKDNTVVREDDERKDVYHIEFNEPVTVHYEVFGNLESLIAKLGFWLVDVDTKTLKDNGEYKLTTEVREYVNGERIRVILIYDKESTLDHEDGVTRERRVMHLKKVIVGKISIINSPVTKVVEEMIKELERFGVGYKFYVSSSYPIIEIRGHLTRMWTIGFEFEYSRCVTITVKDWEKDGPRKIEVSHWCDNEPEIINILIPRKVKLSVDYYDGTLSLMFSYA